MASSLSPGLYLEVCPTVYKPKVSWGDPHLVDGEEHFPFSWGIQMTAIHVAATPSGLKHHQAQKGFEEA